MGQTIALNQPNTRTFGNLTLHANRTADGGYSLTVWAGMEKQSALGITTGDRNTFRARYRLVAEAAIAGVKPEAIADQINAPAAAVLAAAAQVVNTATVEPDAPKVNPLASLAATFAPLRREVRTTKAAPAPTSVAQHRILAAAAANPHGIVNRGRDANIRQLLAMAGKGDGDGLVRLIRDNTRRGYISGAVITDAGRRELARLDGLAAEQARRAQILAGAR